MIQANRVLPSFFSIKSQINSKNLFAFALCATLFVSTSHKVASQSTSSKTINLNSEVRIIAEVLTEDERIPHGAFERQYQANKQIIGRFENGKRVGKWIRFFDSGQPMIVGYYQNGIPSGTWKRLDRNGEEIASFSFDNGTPTGHWHGAYINGNNAIDLIYKKQGELTQAVLYYFNERPGYLLDQEFIEAQTFSYRSLYFKNQTIEEYRETKNKQLHGRLIKYHQTGARWEEYEYQNNLLKEVIGMRAQTGQPLVVGSFENGSGRINHYYSNGMIYKRLDYQNGVPHGYLTYEQNGRELGYGEYKHGKRTGKWIFRNNLGFPEVEFEFDTATSDTAWVIRRTSATEKQALQGIMVQGQRSGVWYATNLTGDTIEEATFSKGLLSGVYKRYSPISKDLQVEGYYTCGTRDSIWQTWNLLDQQTFLDTLNCTVTCSFNPAQSPVNGWLPVLQSNDGYTMLSDNVFGNAVTVFNVVHFIPPLPGVELISEPLTFENLVINELEPEQTEEYSFSPLFIPAEFPGGTTEEERYFDRNRELHEKAETENLFGSMLVGIKLDAFGMAERVDILRGIQPDFDLGVQEYCKQLPIWSPATYNGIPINSYVIKRIDFVNDEIE